MRALMITNYQFHCRREPVTALPRGADFIGYTTR